MSIQNYGVLKGRPIQRKTGTGQSPHYQILIVDNEIEYRISVNIESQDGSEVEFIVVENFQHPLTDQIQALPIGYTALDSKPGGPALDFIRDNLFDQHEMKPLPPTGTDGNDLDDQLDKYIERAISDQQAVVYAFGQRWGPETHKRDQYFGFLPGNGIHDIHMNQGNDGRFANDDGVWQDGALIISFPNQNQWVGIFLKFQSQTWHTDDVTGHRIETTVGVPEQSATPPAVPKPVEPDHIIRIVAVVLSPLANQQPTVTLLNTSPQTINLDKWAILDRVKHKYILSGSLDAGQSASVGLASAVTLGSDGGIITLINPAGLRVDGVAYTQNQVPPPGWSLVF